MEIHQISNYKQNFKGLDYSKANKYIVNKFINIPECPQVLKDLEKLAKKADIYVESSEISFNNGNICEPGIKFTVIPLKKSFFKRLFSKKETSQKSVSAVLNVSYEGLPYNILPLTIKEFMIKTGIIKGIK